MTVGKILKNNLSFEFLEMNMAGVWKIVDRTTDLIGSKFVKKVLLAKKALDPLEVPLPDKSDIDWLIERDDLEAEKNERCKKRFRL